MSKIKYTLLIAVFILLNIVIYIFTEQNQEQRIKLSLDNHTNQLKTHFDILMHQQKISADSSFESILKKKYVLDIFTKAYKTKSKIKRDNLRNELYDLLKDRYRRLKGKGILQFQFVFPNNISFLRLHKPTKYGDDLTNIRSDFKYTNKTKKRVAGFAQGKTSHAFRHVYPIFSKQDKHIGAMEISFSSELLQKNFTEISKMHTHFLVHKSIFNVKTWKRDDIVLKYHQSAEHKDYMMTMTKQHTIQKCITKNSKNLKQIRKKINKNIQKGDKFSLYMKNDKGEIVSLAFIPIFDSINHNNISWIVSYEDNKFIETTLQNTFYIRFLLFTILSILFYFIYRTLNQKEILKELVDEKTIELKDINENLEQKIILEIKKNKQAQDKLFKSEKLASMGEMIGNIAHQWRQPLSVISTGATGMQMQKEYDCLSDEEFNKTCVLINENAQYLSNTIDDFTQYIKGDSKAVNFDLKNDTDSFLKLIDSTIKNNHIDVILDLTEHINIKGYPSELIQCFINIFNNAKDALIENNKEGNRYIFISQEVINDHIVISFKDNAGGIPEEIIDKIFEPYFTTKHQAQGTGLGLNMTYKLIVNSMNGTIDVKNIQYKFNNQAQTGAEFTISLPLVQ